MSERYVFLVERSEDYGNDWWVSDVYFNEADANNKAESYEYVDEEKARVRKIQVVGKPPKEWNIQTQQTLTPSGWLEGVKAIRQGRTPPDQRDSISSKLETEGLGTRTQA